MKFSKQFTKKISTFILVFLAFCFVVLFCSCSKQKEQEHYQKKYDKKGVEKYLEMIDKYGYMPVYNAQEKNATLLLLALKDGNTDLFDTLLQKGASLEECDENLRDGLDYAIEGGNDEIIEHVIQTLPDSYWNKNAKDGKPPVLKLILQSNNFLHIQMALERTQKLDYSDEKAKNIAMYTAQMNIDVRVLKYLLDKNLPLDAKTTNEWTCAMYAARYNPNPAVLESLILRGADTNANSLGLTLIMLASCNDNPGVLMTLLRYKNDINATTTEGKTALMYACENKKNASTIRILCDNGADVNAKDKLGKTALMYALEAYDKNDAIYTLLVAGADTNANDANGKTIQEYLFENKALATTDIQSVILQKTSTDTNAQNISVDATSTENSNVDEMNMQTQNNNATNEEDLNAKSENVEPEIVAE